MWAELKLTNTGGVAIPLVKICLPGEKKKGKIEERNAFSSVYLSSSLVSIIAVWLGNNSRVQLGQQIFLYLSFLVAHNFVTKNILLMIFITLPANKAL